MQGSRSPASSDDVATTEADDQERETLAEVLESWDRETPVSNETRRQAANELDEVGLAVAEAQATGRNG